LRKQDGLTRPRRFIDAARTNAKISTVTFVSSFLGSLQIMTTQDLINCGYAALQKADWLGAKQYFGRALTESDAPESYDGMGIACWWLNEIREAHQYRTAAYNGFKAMGQTNKAAVLACWLGREQVFLYSNTVAMQGWFARADTLLSSPSHSPERAWCLVLRASMEAPPQALEHVTSQVIETAREFGDINLEAFALAFWGLSKVVQGHVQEGMRHLDEAMTMAISKEVRDFMVISEIFCVMLSACEIAADLVRSEQWCQKAWEFAEEHQCPFLSAYCRTTYGSILATMGRWYDAEATLMEAIRAFEAGHQGLRVHAVIRLADLRVSQSRLEEARVLLQGLQDMGAAMVPLARLHLAKGETNFAKAVLEQSLQSCPPYTLNHVPNLVVLIETLLASNDETTARHLVSELIGLAERTQSVQLQAQAEILRGRIHLYVGNTSIARECFVIALDHVKAFQQSFLAGQARLNMAYTLRESDPPGAIVWAKAAFATFDRIGAAHYVE
jgi:tetratricopeptide (TPR) repeat protein